MQVIHPREISWKQLILGEFVGCSTPLWQTIISKFLWFIWRGRNAYVFKSDPPSLANLKMDLFLQMRSVARLRKEEIKKRERALRRGKHAALSYGLLKEEDHILYINWEEEIKGDRKVLEDTDRQVTEWLLEATALYEDVMKDEEKASNLIIV